MTTNPARPAWRLGVAAIVSATLVLTSIPLAALGTDAIRVSLMPPQGWRDLQDISVFRDMSPGGWTGGDANKIEVTSASALPVATDVTHNGLPSMVINVQPDATWWTSLNPVMGWATLNIESYVPNGHLEFYVKGEQGGETFRVGAKDKLYERAEGVEKEVTTAVTDHLPAITTEWQLVKVPLNELFGPGKLDATHASVITFGRETNAGLKVWINDLKLTSPDKEKTYPHIKVNQVGYSGNARKVALVTGFADEFAPTPQTTFEVHDATDDSVVKSGTLTLRTEYDATSGEAVWEADFSDLSTAGNYYLTVDADGVEPSPPFAVGADVYDELLVDATRYFYYQRASVELDATHAPDFPHPLWHAGATSAYRQTNPSVTMDASEGWYDAGDFGKYVNAGATAVSDLLWTYDMFPATFTDNQLMLPESSNGLPDLLDETKVELDWILKMQDADGGFFHRALPETQTTDATFYIEDGVKPTSVTASATAALAHAADVFQPLDPAYAATLLAAAELGWSYLEQHPETIGISPGAYPDASDADNRLWAAGSLFRATGTAAYDDYFSENYTTFESAFTGSDPSYPGQDTTTQGHFVSNMEFVAYLSYMSSTHPKNQQVVSWWEDHYQQWLQSTLQRYDQHPWEITVKGSDYYWGINSQILNTPMDALIGAKLAGVDDAAIRQIAGSSLDYVLGANPLRTSMVTGYGSDTLTYIYSNWYSFDGKPGLPKGYMVGGVNSKESAKLSRFPAKAFQDSVHDWATGEHTVYWNSALVFASAFAAQRPGVVSSGVPLVSGSSVVGSTLTVDAGRWVPSDATMSYQWLADGTPIAGATGTSYVPVTGDIGKELSVIVTGAKSSFVAATATSAKTDPVQGVVAAGLPVISGSPVVESTLTVNAGTWAPSDATLSYQWLANGVAIGGAIGTTYTPVAADVSKILTVTVTGVRSGYVSASATSVATAPVTERLTAAVAITSSDAPTPGGWYQQSVVVALAAPHPGQKVQYSLNGGAWKSYASGISVTANGTTTLASRILKSSNVVSVGSESQVVVKIDKSLPAATITRDPNVSTGTPRNPLSFTFAATDTYSGVTTIQYKVNTGSWVTSETAPLVLDAVGDYVITYRATDAAGNVSAVRSVTATIKANTATTVKSSATSVKRGANVTLTLAGFARWDTVAITYDGTTTSVLTDVNGAAKITVPIPSTAPVGPTTVTATGSTGQPIATTNITIR